MTTQVQALQSLLATEYRTIFGIATAGGTLDVATPASAATATVQTRQAYDSHRLRRDALIAALRATNAAVPQPDSAYATPPTGGTSAALSALARIAEDCAHDYRGALAALSTPALRQLAVSAVADTARYGTRMLLAAGVPAAAATSALPGQSG